MRTFIVPENLQIKNPVTGAELEWITFRRWFIETVLNDQRMGVSPAKLARVLAMMGKATDTPVGSPFSLEDADYEACKPVVTEPQLTLGGPALCAQLLPFSAAFLTATDKG